MKRDINEYPSDAAEIARLVRQADDVTAVRLLQVWGAKQRDIGGIRAIDLLGESINAQA
jgi:hypothetical protein